MTPALCRLRAPGRYAERGTETLSKAWNRMQFGCTGGQDGQQLPLPGALESPQRKGHLSCIFKEEQRFERRKCGPRAFQVKQPAKAKVWRLTWAGAEMPAGCSGGAGDVEGEGLAGRPSPRALHAGQGHTPQCLLRDSGASSEQVTACSPRRGTACAKTPVG